MRVEWQEWMLCVHLRSHVCEAEIPLGGYSHVPMLTSPGAFLFRGSSPNQDSQKVPVWCACFPTVKKQGAAGEEKTLL